MQFVHASGATPLDPDEMAGLIPGHIASQAELNEWEELNIQRATAWAARQHKADLHDDAFVRELHRRMLDRTYRWAGRYRQSDKNIGVPWERVAGHVRDLLADVRYWIEHSTFGPDEIAVRLHHRLVWIHPFSNGNGRHARLMGDLQIQRLGAARFTWGGGASLVSTNEMRATYLAALRAADANDIARLLLFARS